MGGEDPRRVGQREELVAKRAVQLAGQAVGTPADRGEQVGAADIADEQGVTGEHPPRLRVVGVFPHDDADRFGGVTGCVADLQHDVAELEALAVSQRIDRELGPRRVAVGDDGAGGGGQLQVTGEEVGVEVGLDDPLDTQPVAGRIVEVAADVTLRIDHDGTPGRLVADEIAEQRQAGQLVLTEEHHISWGRSWEWGSGNSGTTTGRQPAASAATLRWTWTMSS